MNRLIQIVSAIVLVLLGNAALAADYTLGPRDRIRLKAYEWRVTSDQFVEWKALNDEFTVGADDMISIPFAGPIKATGLALGELEKAIGDRLRGSMGVGRSPSISVEIVEFRPIFVVGDVEKSGEYPYQPGLSVLKTVAIAGGLRRGIDPIRTIRDTISSSGDLNVLNSQIVALSARVARYQAELENRAAMSLPDGLSQLVVHPDVALVVEQERNIFEVRRDAVATQKRAMSFLRDHLEKEIASLNEQMKTEDRQIELVKKELQSVTTLVEKGLSSAPRQLMLERTLAQIEGDRLRVGTALLKARQEVSKTDIALLELDNNRAHEAARELRDSQAKLDEALRKAETARQLLEEGRRTASSLVGSGSSAVRPRFAIVRDQGGKAVELNASEETLLQPGDAVKVEVPIASDRSLPALVVPTQRLPTSAAKHAPEVTTQ